MRRRIVVFADAYSRVYTCGLEDIEARTLILWGEHDLMRGRCCFDQRIPDSTLVVVEGTNHMLVKSPRTAELARQFLDKTLSSKDITTCTDPCPSAGRRCD
jgi:pimeloyl-ACP methyl ester carboxylesterase